MKPALIIMIVLFLAVMGAGYYFYSQIFEPMLQQATTLGQEKATLSDERNALARQVNELQKETEEKEKEVETVTQTYTDLIAGMEKEIETGQIQISELEGKLKVNIVDKVLFDSGEATVSVQGQKILARLGNILKKEVDKVIRVEGHTDNVKIHRRLQKKYPTNWELSTNRATNVVRFMQDELAIPGRRLEAVGYAEFRPKASNATVKGRAQNRRIELVLVPQPISLTQ